MTETRKPLRASASAAVSPPIPAPAMSTVRACVPPPRFGDGSSSRLVQRTFSGNGLVRRKRGAIAEQGRAVGADDFALVTHVEENMRMVERRPRADAHELLGADLDHRPPGIVVEMRNDVFGHAAGHLDDT